MKRSLLAAALVAAGLLFLVALPGQAAVTCAFEPATGVLRVAATVANEEVKLIRAGDAITVEARVAPTAFTAVTCTGGAPTVTTTDRIVVAGSAANNQDLRIDLAGGPFAPGRTVADEVPGSAEIEFDVDLGEPAPATPPPPADSGDGVIVSGSTGPDIITVGAGGINLNNDDDADVSPLAGADDAAADRQLLGGDGDDTLSAAGGAATGAPAPATTLNGGNGADTLSGGDKTDTLTGGAGNDVANGGADADTLNGDAGQDTLGGGAGNDTLGGGSENDTLSGEAGNDTVSGGTGDDTLGGGDGTDTLNGDAGADTLNGGAGADTLNGGEGNDVENGDADDDVFDQGNGLPNGTDVMNGAAGIDEVRYSGRGRAVVVTLDGVANDGDPTTPGENDNAGADNLIENVVGTLYPDTLTGNALDNILSGNPGRDTLTGGAGADLLRGGADDDAENGGDGNDTFDQEVAANGSDAMAGGAGTDAADYSKRLNLVSVTPDGVANDGEAGERDNVAADVETSPPPGATQPPDGTSGDSRRLALVGSSDLGGRGLNGEVAVVGDTAVVAGGYVPMNIQDNAHTKVAAQNTDPPCVTVPVKVVDLTDPTRPRVSATIPVAEGQAARDVDLLSVNTPSFRGNLAAIALATCKFDEKGLTERGVALQGSYAHRGVVYYDVTDPAQPRLLGRYFADFDNVNPDAGPCGPGSDSKCAKDQFSVHLRRIRDGRILSVSGKSDSAELSSPTGDIRLVDVTDPRKPTQIGLGWPTLGDAPPRTSNNGCYPRAGSRSAEFSTDGTKLYVPYLDGGLFTLDILDLANPRLLGQWNYPQDWNVEGNGAYVTQTDVGGRQLALLADEDWWWPTSAFRVESPVSLSGVNPGCSDLFTIADLGYDSQIHRQPGGQLAGELAYIGRGCPERRAPDGTPIAADPYLIPESDLRGKLAFADRATNPPTQPGLPAQGCSFNSRVRRAQDLGATGLVLVSNPTPEAVAGFPPLGSSRRPTDETGAPTGDLSIPGFQIKKPIGDALRTAMCPSTSGTPLRCTGGLPARGTLMDLAGEWGGMRVIDVTNPAKPSQTAVFRTPNAQVFPPPDYRGIYSVHHAVARGDVAYVAWNSDGLRVLDLKTPQPTEVFSFVPPDTNDPTGTVPAKAYVQGVAISNRHLVISDVNSGIYVFSAGAADAAKSTGGPAGAAQANAAAQRTAVAGVTTSRGASQTTRGPLPSTGSSLLGWVVLALLLVAGGIALMLGARRFRAQKSGG